ncbi:MAG: hypothetical protein ABI586_10170 [Candidatus Nanopelagicales bacterium]
MKRLLILTLTVAALIFAPLVPAQAHAPKQTTDKFNGTVHIQCDGFQLLDRVHMTAHIQSFFREHKLVRRTIHYRWQGTITNRATGEFVATDPAHWQDTISNHLRTTRGQYFSIKIASLGINIQGVGKTVTNLRTGEIVFQSSTDAHHQNYDDLCEALA